MVIVFERGHRPHRQGLCHPFCNAQPRYPQTAADASDALTGVIPNRIAARCVSRFGTVRDRANCSNSALSWINIDMFC
jgi:hypothetical protein